MHVADREFAIVHRLLSACSDDVTDGARPSVESFMHCVLGRCVIHLHALAPLAYASAKNGQEEVFRLFRDEPFPPLWIPYADPGYSLGRKASRLVGEYERRYGAKPAITFMAKHGLLVVADTAEQALRNVRQVIARCKSGMEQPVAVETEPPGDEEIDGLKRTIEKALIDATGQRIPVSHFADATIRGFLAGKETRKLVSAAALTPDEMGFVNGPVVWLEKYDYRTVAARIGAHVARGWKPANAFLARDMGLFVAAEAKVAAMIRDIVAGSLFVRYNAARMGGINPLNRRQREFIDNWEAEQFRVQLAGSG